MFQGIYANFENPPAERTLRMDLELLRELGLVDFGGRGPGDSLVAEAQSERVAVSPRECGRERQAPPGRPVRAAGVEGGGRSAENGNHDPGRARAARRHGPQRTSA